MQMTGGQGGQDWNQVVFSKKHTGAAASASKNVRAAQQAGGDVDTVKKYATGGNSQATTGTGMSAKKLDEETEDFHVERVNTELKKQILQARTGAKMTQAQLAKAINEKPNVIQEYESGKAIPNPQVLQKMSRVLGVPLSKTGGKTAAPKKKPAGSMKAKPIV
eukprot:jgi/Ulvmu1/8627/UM046_0028.1